MLLTPSYNLKVIGVLVNICYKEFRKMRNNRNGSYFYLKRPSSEVFFKGALRSLIKIKNAFYFTLNALFVLKIFKFLS